MSRASWYRHGKPTTKPEPKVTRRHLAEALGISVRTVQRDRAAAKWKTVTEIRQAKAEGRGLDVAAVDQLFTSHVIAKCRERETAVWKPHVRKPRIATPRPTGRARTTAESSETCAAYLDRLTVPSNSIVWRPERQPRTEA
jgi:hypothetical protein